MATQLGVHNATVPPGRIPPDREDFRSRGDLGARLRSAKGVLQEVCSLKPQKFDTSKQYNICGLGCAFFHGDTSMPFDTWKMVFRGMNEPRMMAERKLTLAEWVAAWERTAPIETGGAG